MKSSKKYREAEPLGMAFLDVMACGFGAVVLLLTLVKEDVLEIARDSVQINISVAENTLEKQNREIKEEEKTIAQLEARLVALKEDATRVREASATLRAQNSDAKQGSLIPSGFENLYNAGIPVRDKHVIFIIDTSN